MMSMFSDLRAFRRNPLALMDQRVRADGSALVRLRLGPQPVYLVTDPELARAVLRADEKDADKGRYVRKLRPVVGLNSLTMSGEEQQQRRAVVHRGLVEGMAHASTAEIGSAIRRWILEMTQVDEIDVGLATAHLALRLVCAMLFGQGALSSGDEAALIEAFRVVETDLAADMFRLAPLAPWTALRRARRRREAREMMGWVVDRTSKGATRGSLIAGLRGAGVHGDALRDEILFLLLAGHHTTGAASAWTLWHQATDPELTRSLVAEAEQLDREGGELKPQALRKARFSRAVVSEALRLYPSSYWTSRELNRDQTIGEVKLKRGANLIIAPWQLHRDARYWPDPTAFRLDRDWNSNSAYMPFGIGGRACTGMAMATFMIQVVLLQFAATFECEIASPPAGPIPSVTLLPPPMRFRLSVRRSLSSEARGAAA